MELPHAKSIDMRGYYPGVIGRITEVHAVYYNTQWGFNASFELQVARELSDFMAAFQNHRDGFWAAAIEDRFAGSIAIDGRRATDEGARLRWFIVPPALQGLGVGDALMDRGLNFCRRVGHRRVYLWTFAGLEAARRLYLRHGFQLVETHADRPWGPTIREQKYELVLA